MAYQTQGSSTIFNTLLTANDSTRKETLGTMRELADGRRFRYIRMTGGAAALGTVLIPAAVVTVTDVSAGGTTVGPDGASTTLITDSDATWVANAYVGWYWQTKAGGTGTTEPIKIVGNTTTTLTLEKTLGTTVIAGDDGEILPGVAAAIISAVTDTGQPVVGIGIGTLTENYYGWVQTAGIAAVLGDTITENESICPGGNAEGQAIVADADADNNVIGVCVGASGDNQNQMVDLRIAQKKLCVLIYQKSKMFHILQEQVWI